MNRLFDAFPGAPQVGGMARFRPQLAALRRELAGLWVAYEDDSRLTVMAPANDDESLSIAGDLFIPHPFWPGLFRTALQHSCLMPHAGLLWFKHDGTPWHPYCRPGLSELSDPPPTPDTSFALDDALAQLATMAGVWRAEVQRDADHGLGAIKIGLDSARHTWLRIANGRVEIAEVHATL
jgi:hypothetical protein